VRVAFRFAMRAGEDETRYGERGDGKQCRSLPQPTASAGV